MKLTYTGLGVVRKFNPLIDSVSQPKAFNTPVSKWVSCELHWTTGFDNLIFESAEAAEAKAKALGIPFLDRNAARTLRSKLVD